MDNSKITRNQVGVEEGGKNLQAGVYKHPATGVEIITQSHPLYGNAQSEAAYQVGFRYDRPAVASDIKEIVNDLGRPTEATSRIDALELSEAKRRVAELEAQLATPAPVAEVATPELPTAPEIGVVEETTVETVATETTTEKLEGESNV